MTLEGPCNSVKEQVERLKVLFIDSTGDRSFDQMISRDHKWIVLFHGQNLAIIEIIAPSRQPSFEPWLLRIEDLSDCCVG